MDAPKESCGLFAYYGFEVNKNAENIVLAGLRAQQHRGQENVGINSYNPDNDWIYEPRKAVGLVRDFEKEFSFDDWDSSISLGHVRYSTTGGKKNIVNAQPFIFYSDRLGCFTMAHNGQLTNVKDLKRRIQEHVPFQSTSDTELIAHLMTLSEKTSLEGALIDALNQVDGSYSLIVMGKGELIAARDPMGNKPFSLAKFNLNGEFAGYAIASETCAFKYLKDRSILDVSFERDIYPGEVLVMSGRDVGSYFPFPERKTAHCIFELIYFSSPGSESFGVPVGKFRMELGKILSLQDKFKYGSILDNAGVIAVPDSGNLAAAGYANESKLPLKPLLIKRHYGDVFRTFIEPDPNLRFIKQREKFETLENLFEEGEEGIIVDDSIVRSNTSKNVVKIAKEHVDKLHFRVASPPIKFPCPLGIDFATYSELGINKQGSIENLKEHIGAETLEYLPLDRPDWAGDDVDVASLKELVAKFLPGENFCFACFDGKYPCSVDNLKKKYFGDDTND